MGNILRVSPIFQLILQLYERFSRSNHYAQLGNALQKHFFAYSALIMGTLSKVPPADFLISVFKVKILNEFDWV